MKEKIRAIGYVRVSSDGQADGESPNFQATEIRTYSQANDWELLGIEQDLGISGSKSENRPGWQTIQRMSRNKECDVVIVLKLSRFARNTREALNIQHELQKHGVALVSIKEKFDTTNPSGKLSFQMLSMIAEWEREVIREQMHDNKMVKWRDLRLFTGKAPYGYIWNKAASKMEEYSPESELLNRIFRLYANAGLSMKDIVIRLNAEGCKSRSGTNWSNGTISGIFDNKVYGTCQLVTNTRIYDEDGKRTKELKPECEWITYPMPRIVPLSLWQKVQTRRDFNCKKQKRTTWQQDYWLRDNIVCSNCGGKIVSKHGSTRNDGTFPRYYACYWGLTSDKDALSSGRKKCKADFYLKANSLENYIWDRLTGELTGSWRGVAEEEQANAQSRFDKLFGIENLENRKTETQQVINKLLKDKKGKELANFRLSHELEKDEADVSLIMRFIRNNQQEINTVDGKISELENELVEFKGILHDHKQLLENKDMLFDAWNDLQNFSPIDKKRFLESLVPGGIIIYTHPKINSMLDPSSVKMEIVFNFDIFQILIEEGKFPSFGKNGSIHHARFDLGRGA